MITIQNFHFDFKSSDEDFIHQLYGRWDTFFRVSVENMADDVLSRYDSQTETITIETLEIHLDTFTQDEFYEKYPKRFEVKLKEAFEEQLKYKEKYGVKICSTSTDLIEQLRFYLLHGYQRLDQQGQPFQFNVLLLDLIRLEPDKTYALMEEIKHLENVRLRLIYQLNDKEIEKLVLLTDRQNASFINRFCHFLIHSNQISQCQEITQNNYRNIIWSVVLTYLWSNNRGHFSRKELIRQTLVQLANHYGLKTEFLLNLLVTEIVHIPTDLVMQELTQIITELWQECKTDQPATEKKADQLIAKTEIQTESQIIHQQPFIKKETFMENSMTNKVASFDVVNAGLTILNPYLPLLFRRLSLIDDNTRRFKSKEEQIRAVFILQAFINTDNNHEYKEEELILNKLLTGLPLNEPLPRSLQLTSEELDIVEQLLKAVKTNWSKLQNTSNQGLIDTFFKRRGSITEEDQSWNIRVEEKPYDILMDSMPWSFKMIRFPWTPKTITVSWR